MSQAPRHIDIKRDRGMTVQWADGSGSYYSAAYLRRMSPSADVRELRRAMSRNPLTVLPDLGGVGGALEIEGAELVGHYAIRIRFSDGHSTGIYTWEYLREIDPNSASGEGPISGDPTAPHHDPLGLGGGG